jgi:hypothetical protein
MHLTAFEIANEIILCKKIIYFHLSYFPQLRTTSVLHYIYFTLIVTSLWGMLAKRVHYLSNPLSAIEKLKRQFQYAREEILGRIKSFHFTYEETEYRHVQSNITQFK